MFTRGKWAIKGVLISIKNIFPKKGANEDKTELGRIFARHPFDASILTGVFPKEDKRSWYHETLNPSKYKL